MNRLRSSGYLISPHLKPGLLRVTGKATIYPGLPLPANRLNRCTSLTPLITR